MFPGDELKQKISTEKNEIERLQQDIVELQMIREDLYDSDDAPNSSSSSDESEDDDELREVLRQLVLENEELEVRTVH